MQDSENNFENVQEIPSENHRESNRQLIRKIPYFLKEEPDQNTSIMKRDSVVYTLTSENPEIFNLQEILFFKKEENLSFHNVLPEKTTITPNHRMLNSKHAPSTFNEEQLKILSLLVKQPNSKLMSEQNSKLVGDSLFLFSATSLFRKKCIAIQDNNWFHYTNTIVTLVNILGMAINDYSYRVDEVVDEYRSGVNFAIQLCANIYFTFVFFTRIIAFGFLLGQDLYKRKIWNIINLLDLIGGYGIYIGNYYVECICRILSFLRPLRIIQEIESSYGFNFNVDFLIGLSESAVCFIETIFSVSSILLNLFILILFYSIFSLHLFNGLLENRCRMEPLPEEGIWLANPNITRLCGWKDCPINNYCGNPAGYGIAKNYSELNLEQYHYGTLNFNNIFESFLVNLNFIMFSGWFDIYSNYSDAFNEYIVLLYCYSCLFFSGIFIFNLLLAHMYKTFNSIANGIKSQKKILVHRVNAAETVFVNPSKNFITETKGNLAELNLKMLASYRRIDTFKNITNLQNSKVNKSASSLPASARKQRISGINDTLMPSTLSPLHSKNMEEIKLNLENKYQKNDANEILKIKLSISYPKYVLDNQNIFGKLLKHLNTVMSPAKSSLIANVCESFIFLIVFADGIILSLMRRNMKQTEVHYYEIFENILIIIFVGEFVFRVSTNGLKKFWSNFFNKIDTVIISINAIFLIYAYITKEYLYNSNAGYVALSLKTLRVFRFIVGMNWWAEGSMLFIEMIQSIKKTLSFIIIIFIALIIATFIAMELFAYRVKAHEIPDSEQNRYVSPTFNFDEFLPSFVANILLFLDEYWAHVVMIYVKDLNNSIGVFFAFNMIVGQIFLTKMFMVLYINNLLNSRLIKDLLELESKFSNFFKHIKVNLVKIFVKKQMIKRNTIMPGEREFESKNTGFINSQNNFIELQTKRQITTYPKSSQFEYFMVHLRKQLDSMGKSLNLQGDSLFCFSNDNSFRKICSRISNSNLFMLFKVISIICSIILLILSDPFDSPDSSFNICLRYSDLFIVGLLFFEILIKIIATGFIFNGENSYIFNLWNIIELLVFILNLLGVIHLFYPYARMRTQWVRGLRLFHIIGLIPSLKTITHTILQSFPQIINLILFTFLMIYFFALIATKFLQNTFFHCDFSTNMILELKLFEATDCFDYGGNWINDGVVFDNILFSLSSLFQIATNTGWYQIMEESMQNDQKTTNPQISQNIFITFFFISFFIFFNLIVMNVFVGILVESYFILKEKNSPLVGLSEIEKEWASIKKMIYIAKPKKAINFELGIFREKCRHLLKLKTTVFIFQILHILNIGIFTLYWNRQEATMARILDIINCCFLIIFTLKALLRLFIYGHFIFMKKYPWDLIIFLLSWGGQIYVLTTYTNDWKKSMAYAFQLVRMFRIIQIIPWAKNFYICVIKILPEASMTLLLIIIILLIYAIIGVDFFCYLKPQHGIDGNKISFQSIGRAFVVLTKIVTFEEWFVLIADCVRHMEPNFVCSDIKNYSDYVKYGLNGCGDYLGYAYFYSLVIIVGLLIFNLFVPIMLHFSEEVTIKEMAAVNIYQISEIKLLWMEFDPKGQGYINYKDFSRFFKKSALTLGVSHVDFLMPSNRSNFLKMLDLPLYINKNDKVLCYRFHDVLLTLAQLSVFLNYGYIKLEPDEGLPHLKHYEIKLLKKKDYDLTFYRSGDVEKFQRIMKFYKKWRQKYLHKLTGIKKETLILDFKTLMKKIGNSIVKQETKPLANDETKPLENNEAKPLVNEIEEANKLVMMKKNDTYEQNNEHIE